MPVPLSLSYEEMRGLPPQWCEVCAKEGHQVTAVERAGGIYFCLVCRDGDVCLTCSKMRKDREVRQDSKPITLKAPRAVRPPEQRFARVSLNDIIDEYEKVDGVDIRFPTEDEIAERFHRRSRVAWLDDLLKAILKSPTGHAEIPVPKGMKAHSLQSTLARHIRQKKLHYTCYCDSKRNSVVVSNAVQHRN